MWWSESTYGPRIVAKYGLYITGLPLSEERFGHPSNTKGGIARLVMLRRMWETGEIAFAKASEEMRWAAEADPASVFPKTAREQAAAEAMATGVCASPIRRRRGTLAATCQSSFPPPPTFLTRRDQSSPAPAAHAQPAKEQTWYPLSMLPLGRLTIGGEPHEHARSQRVDTKRAHKCAAVNPKGRRTRKRKKGVTSRAWVLDTADGEVLVDDPIDLYCSEIEDV